MTSRLKPRRSVQRRYMRSSISAQSCDSVPPAPGMDGDDRVLAIVLAAEHLLGLAGLDFALDRSSSAAREIVVDRLARLGPFDEHGEIVGAAPAATSLRSRSSSSRRRRCSSFCASAWSFQKSGSATRASMSISSSAGVAASKIAPQVGGAARQILIPAKLFVQL